MSFNVLWAPQARRDLGELPIEIQRRVVAKVRASANDPIRFFKRLKGEPLWSLRIGEYRALGAIDLRAGRIEILTIGHRRKVYDH